jgi:hypothetical protein
LKLANCPHVIEIDVFLTIVFRVGLLPYLILTTIGMKQDTLIKHKEAIVICDKSGLVNVSYNVLLTTPKVNIVVKPIRSTCCYNKIHINLH